MAGFFDAMEPIFSSSRFLAEKAPNIWPGTARAWPGDMPNLNAPKPSSAGTEEAGAALVTSTAHSAKKQTGRGMANSPPIRPVNDKCSFTAIVTQPQAEGENGFSTQPLPHWRESSAGASRKGARAPNAGESVIRRFRLTCPIFRRYADNIGES